MNGSIVSTFDLSYRVELLTLVRVKLKGVNGRMLV